MVDKPIVFLGSTLADIRAFPDDVCDVVGFARRQAQQGRMHPDAKPLRGYGGAGVLEVVEDDDGDIYRAVYTVKFRDTIYVLTRSRRSRSGVVNSRSPTAN